MEWGLFVGLLAIAVAVYFGLSGFRKDVSDKLSDIRDKIIAMGTTMDKAWDLLKIRFGVATGTVERNLKNLGKTKITASPATDKTIYFIEVEKAVLYDGLIIKLSKESDLENKEKQLFSGRVPSLFTTLGTRLTIEVPCTESKLCTEYISLLLKWLDTTYYESLSKIKDYEEPIQI